jgi:hypothetical protein
MHCAQRPIVPETVSQQIAFRIRMMRSCIGNRGWPVIGCVSLPGALRAIPDFYQFDAIARQFSLDRGRAQAPATCEKCALALSAPPSGARLLAAEPLGREPPCR